MEKRRIEILKSELVYELASAAYLAAEVMSGLTDNARTQLRDLSESENLHLVERYLDEGMVEAASAASLTLIRKGEQELPSLEHFSDVLRRPESWFLESEIICTESQVELLTARLHRFLTQYALARLYAVLTGGGNVELEESASMALAQLREYTKMVSDRKRVRLRQTPF